MKFRKADLRIWHYCTSESDMIFYFGQHELKEWVLNNIGTPVLLRMPDAIGASILLRDGKLGLFSLFHASEWKNSVVRTDRFLEM